jgi:transcriptional regulator with XRE-family HTH domain
MNLEILIDSAAKKHGSLGELALSLGKNQSRLSEWKKGKQKPDANEIAYLAECAGLPVFETVGEIQMQLDNRFTTIWQAALNKLRDAQESASAGLTSNLAMQTGQINDWRKR